MKFGQILVCCMTNICNMFLAQCWRLKLVPDPFYDFIKMTLRDMVIFNSWHLPFLKVFIHLFEKGNTAICNETLQAEEEVLFYFQLTWCTRLYSLRVNLLECKADLQNIYLGLSRLCFSLGFCLSCREISYNCNPLQPGVAFLYSLKTSENLKAFWCFQGV